MDGKGEVALSGWLAGGWRAAAAAGRRVFALRRFGFGAGGRTTARNRSARRPRRVSPRARRKISRARGACTLRKPKVGGGRIGESAPIDQARLAAHVNAFLCYPPREFETIRMVVPWICLCVWVVSARIADRKQSEEGRSGTPAGRGKKKTHPASLRIQTNRRAGVGLASRPKTPVSVGRLCAGCGVVFLVRCGATVCLYATCVDADQTNNSIPPNAARTRERRSESWRKTPRRHMHSRVLLMSPSFFFLFPFFFLP